MRWSDTCAYPFTVDVYAYTTTSAMNNPNVEKLIEWIVSEEGQHLIELTLPERTIFAYSGK